MKLRKVLAGAMALVMVAGSVLVAPVNANAAEADTTTGLVGYYSFEDTIDNHVSESGKATVHGGAGATWGAKADATGTYADGKVNKAYSFAGDGDARGDGLWLDVKTSATGAYSLSMWVNTAEKINFQPVAFMAADFWNYVAIGTLYNDSGSAAIVSAANAEIGVAPTVNAVWTFADCFYEGCPATVGDLPLNTWTYVTLTVSADGKMALYHNAELVKEVQMANCDGSITAERFANRDLYLGINFWDRSFKGMMDEVSVYHRALSADDVAALYAANGVPVIPVEGIALDATEKNVVVGDTFTLKATTSPSYVTTDTTVTWTSSNEEVATVDTTGKVTAVAKGDATITATVAGTIKATCTVKVVEEANKITAFDLSADKTEIKIGATAQLTAKITLENNDKEATESTTVTYKSSDEKVATVDKDGKVTAVAIGKATITATVGTFTDTVEITVPAVPATAIDAKADKTELKVGETATITATVTPEDTTDAIAWATSNGDVVTVDNGKVTAVGAGTATVTITAGDIKEEIKFTVT